MLQATIDATSTLAGNAAEAHRARCHGVDNGRCAPWVFGSPKQIDSVHGQAHLAGEVARLVVPEDETVVVIQHRPTDLSRPGFRDLDPPQPVCRLGNRGKRDKNGVFIHRYSPDIDTQPIEAVTDAVLAPAVTRRLLPSATTASIPLPHCE